MRGGKNKHCPCHDRGTKTPERQRIRVWHWRRKKKNRRGYLEECFLEVNGPIKTSILVTNSSQSGPRDPPAPISLPHRGPLGRAPPFPPTAKRSHLAETSSDEWSRRRRDEEKGAEAEWPSRIDVEPGGGREREERAPPLLLLTRPDGCRPYLPSD